MKIVILLNSSLNNHYGASTIIEHSLLWKKKPACSPADGPWTARTKTEATFGRILFLKTPAIFLALLLPKLDMIIASDTSGR
jgi:hypothetical protein